jgi:hypothetical protein
MATLSEGRVCQVASALEGVGPLNPPGAGEEDERQGYPVRCQRNANRAL